jgi:hypothetical protein
MSFFLNHGYVKWCPLKQTKSKNGQRFYFKNFENYETFMLGQKIFELKKIRTMVFVVFSCL